MVALTVVIGTAFRRRRLQFTCVCCESELENHWPVLLFHTLRHLLLYRELPLGFACGHCGDPGS